MSIIQMNQKTQLALIPKPVTEVFSDSDVVKQFEDILRGGTNSFINSAMLTIAASDDLLACTPRSWVLGALRSASLGLSLDPALRQAWLVPRPLAGVWTACFQPHYNGLYDLAVRTNRYRTISVAPVYRGDEIVVDPRTGLHYITGSDFKYLYKPHRDVQGFDSGYRVVTGGSPSLPIIGYLGYFLTRNGFEKTVWKTLAEIQAHALLWSPSSYNSSKGAWQDRKKRPVMEMKTVFIALSKFMDLSGEDNFKLREAILDEVALEGDAEPVETKIIDIDPTPAELLIESTVPAGPSPAEPVITRAKPNQTITDSEWETFGKLVQRATNANINLPEYKREKMTPDTLNGATQYIKGKLQK